MSDKLKEAAVGPDENLTGEVIDPTAGMSDQERQAFIQEKLHAVRELQSAIQHADYATDKTVQGAFANDLDRTAPTYYRVHLDEHGGIYRQILTNAETRRAGTKFPTAHAPKVVKVDPDFQFNEIPSRDGKRIRTPQVRQFRVGYAAKKLDWARWELELRSLGLARAEEIFPWLGHYCERLDCYELTEGGAAFCSKTCQAEVGSSRWRAIEFD